MEKIGFKEMKWYLKILVVYGFISMAISILWFIVGFVMGTMGVY